MSVVSSPTAAARTGVVQIALSVLDGQRSHDWYAEGLGLLPAGTLQPSTDLSAVQGVPDAKLANLLWLVDANPFFQFEIFQYATPPVRPQPADRRACDLGYSRFGVWVADLDATLERLRTLGTNPLTPPIGAAGTRRVCVLDPDGVIVELMEDRVPTPDQAPSTGPGRVDQRNTTGMRRIELTIVDGVTTGSLSSSEFGNGPAVPR